MLNIVLCHCKKIIQNIEIYNTFTSLVLIDLKIDFFEALRISRVDL